MTDLRTRGTVNKAKGKLEEGAGKLVGNPKVQAKGKVHQDEGSAQQALCDAQDSVRRA